MKNLNILSKLSGLFLEILERKWEKRMQKKENPRRSEPRITVTQVPELDWPAGVSGKGRVKIPSPSKTPRLLLSRPRRQQL